MGNADDEPSGEISSSCRGEVWSIIWSTGVELLLSRLGIGRSGALLDDESRRVDSSCDSSTVESSRTEEHSGIVEMTFLESLWCSNPEDR